MKTLLDIDAFIQTERSQMLDDIQERGQAEDIDEAEMLLEDFSLNDEMENLIFEQGMARGMQILFDFIKQE